MFNPVLAASDFSKLGWPFFINSGASAHLRYWCVRLLDVIERNEATPPLLFAESPITTSAGLRERNYGSGSMCKARLLWWDILALTSVVEDAVSPATTEAALENVKLGPRRSLTSSRWPKTLSNGY